MASAIREAEQRAQRRHGGATKYDCDARTFVRKKAKATSVAIGDGFSLSAHAGEQASERGISPKAIRETLARGHVISVQAGGVRKVQLRENIVVVSSGKTGAGGSVITSYKYQAAPDKQSNAVRRVPSQRPPCWPFVMFGGNARDGGCADSACKFRHPSNVEEQERLSAKRFSKLFEDVCEKQLRSKKNKCENRDKCMALHLSSRILDEIRSRFGIVVQQDPPQQQRPDPCLRYLLSVASKNESNVDVGCTAKEGKCAYFHPATVGECHQLIEEIRASTCERCVSTNFCPNETVCTQSHPPPHQCHTLRRWLGLPEPPALCWYFLLGSCKRNERCANAHPPVAESQSIFARCVCQQHLYQGTCEDGSTIYRD